MPSRMFFEACSVRHPWWTRCATCGRVPNSCKTKASVRPLTIWTRYNKTITIITTTTTILTMAAAATAAACITDRKSSVITRVMPLPIQPRIFTCLPMLIHSRVRMLLRDSHHHQRRLLLLPLTFLLLLLLRLRNPKIIPPPPPFDISRRPLIPSAAPSHHPPWTSARLSLLTDPHPRGITPRCRPLLSRPPHRPIREEEEEGTLASWMAAYIQHRFLIRTVSHVASRLIRCRRRRRTIRLIDIPTMSVRNLCRLGLLLRRLSRKYNVQLANKPNFSGWIGG